MSHPLIVVYMYIVYHIPVSVNDIIKQKTGTINTYICVRIGQN